MADVLRAALCETLAQKEVVRLSAQTATELREKMNKYLTPETAGDMEIKYWPPIKSVHIFCKAEVLENGTVLVDLPGVQYSNPARAAAELAEAARVENCDAVQVVSASPSSPSPNDET